VVFGASVHAATSRATGREEIDLGFGWRFAAGPRTGVMWPDYPDGEPTKKWQQRDWHDVDLPHDFQFSCPWDEKASRSRGYKAMETGWYRQRVFADPAWRGKRVALDFGGILCRSEVYLNGDKVADDDYGYLGFEVDVSDRLRWGETNVVAVMATTGEVRGGRWYTGGGLYRGVKLVVRDQVSVSRHGVFVTTPTVTDARAEVAVEVDIDGFTRCTNDLEVTVRLLDPDKREVCRSSVLAPKDIRLKRTHVTVPRMTIEMPRRWDIDDPALYTAVVTLVEDGVERDRVKTRFGIRTIEFGTEFGFRLNGRKVFLKSVSNHHDLGALGAAAYPRAIERQFRVMKEFGYNAIRCSHNPYSQEFMDLADEVGILVVDELADKWTGDSWLMGRPITDRFFPLITEWVRRDRNHPCVILWSLGNELQFREKFAGYDTGDWGVTTYRMMDVFVKRFDPTRLTTVGLFPSRAGAVYRKDPRYNEKPILPPELADVMDVASFNYVWHNYPDYLKWNPNLIIFQSEASTFEWLNPFFGMDRERTVGLSWWGAIEYWGESNGWPKKGWNYSFFSHTLEPRPPAWLARSGLVADEPLTRIGVVVGKGEREIWNDVLSGQFAFSENWNATGESTRDIFVFSNAGEVELLLNGVSLGAKKTVNNVAKWEGVAYAPGKLEARGSNGSAHVLETTGAAARLELVEEAPGDWNADGVDLKYLRIYAVDEEGRRVPDATNRLAVSVAGDARLIALDNGDHYTNEQFAVPEKAMKDGFMLAILRAGRTGGEVKVSVRAEGIIGVEWNMKVKGAQRR
jgi:beta-galactosidase